MVYSALDLSKFLTNVGQKLNGLLKAYMNIALNKTGNIDVDDILPYPNTVSFKIMKYKSEAKQDMTEKIDTAMSE